jgi:hypothetical protein
LSPYKMAIDCNTQQQQQQQRQQPADAISHSTLASAAGVGIQEAAGSGSHDVLLLECQHLLWHQLSLPGLDQLDTLMGAASWQQAALEAAAATASSAPHHAVGVVTPSPAGLCVTAQSADSGCTPSAVGTSIVMTADRGGAVPPAVKDISAGAEMPLLLLQPVMSAPPKVCLPGEQISTPFPDHGHSSHRGIALEAAASAPLEAPGAVSKELTRDQRLPGTVSASGGDCRSSNMLSSIEHNTLHSRSLRPLTSFRQITPDDLDDVDDSLPAAKRSKSPAYEAASSGRRDQVAPGEGTAGLQGAGAGSDGFNWLQMMRQ